jgi:O-antigen/teichoic acid export membrane protein
MLEKLIDDQGEQAGKYAQGFRLFEALNMVIFMFAGLLLPIFSRLLKEKQDVLRIFLLAVKMLFSGGLIIGVPAFFYRAHIMDFRYDGTSLVADDSFGMLMLSFFVISTTFLFSTLLTAGGKLKELNITSGIGLTLNVILNFLLIPNYGAFGAAIASLSTQGMAGLAQIVISRNQFKFKVNVTLIVKMVLLTTLAFVMGLFFETKLNWEWSYEFLIMLLTLTIGCFLTGLLNPIKIFDIIKDRNNKR